MKRVIIISLALIMVISAIAWAADTVGAFAASKSGVGARALAMGGAFVAIANNATAMHWNPAGLAQVNDTRLTGMTTDLSGSGWITHNVLAATTMFSNIGIGLGWDSVSTSYVDLDLIGSTAITWNESVVLGSVAMGITESVYAGVNVKYYMATDNNDQSAKGFGFDLGLLFDLGEMFSFGINAADIGGSTITWDDNKEETVTALYKFGGALKLLDGNLIVTADVDFVGNNFNMGDIHFGTEIQIIEEFALRAGVLVPASLHDASAQDFCFSVGAGVSVAGLYVDVAYLLQDLGSSVGGNTLFLSAEFSFGDLLGVGEGGESLSYGF
ncbi:hypothetical protein KAV67_04280 [Candidatus Bipolaricaulota bacterium]|nr:hypothetical protein [Candidatus Bipolaricaulota bacterium]